MRSLPWIAPLGLAVALAANAADPNGESRTPVASVEGRVWYADEVGGAVAFRVYQHEVDIHSLVRGETEDRVDAFLLEREAERRGTSVEAMLADVESGAEAVSDDDVDAYLAEQPAERSGASASEMSARVRHYLEETRRLERRIAFLEGLRDAAGYRFLLPAPSPPRTEVDVAGAPVRGPRDARVEIVHFASFSSRNSARSAAKIERITEAFPGQVRWIHRNLFRERDERGLRAARLGHAASSERFWQLHDAWFARRGKLALEEIDAIAHSNGVSTGRIASAATDDALLRKVKRWS
jgi:hypothetical protein